MKVLNTKLCVVLILTGSFVCQATAYEEDTHFGMTYIICRAVGFTPDEALKVAAVDQGMDDSPGVVAVDGATPNVAAEWMWHALDRDGNMGPKGVVKRKQELFNLALSKRSDPQKLFYLGVFFHYQQDTWSHRHHYDGQPHSLNNFTTYDTPVGHALAWHQPDRPPFDPVAAYMSLEDGIYWASTFLQRGFHRTPNAFFSGIVANAGMVGKVDEGWDDSRKGKYFHQLALEGQPGTARRFLSKLIRAQVNAYSSSTDAYYDLRWTANLLEFETFRKALQGVCSAWASNIRVHITIPNLYDKQQQGYMHLTTQQILDGTQ